MNIDSVFKPSISSLEAIESATQLHSTSLVEKLWGNSLQCTYYLAQQILSKEEQPLANILQSLTSHPIHYEQCKKNYVDAYLNCFNEFEKNTYLKDFLAHFDPQRKLIEPSKLTQTEENVLWEGLIRYFCDHYLEFQAKSSSLLSLFQKVSSFPAKELTCTESDLDQAFDQGLDFLLDYSKPTGRIIESKVLFFAYLARLINELEKMNLLKSDPSTALQESITLLFEELYFYLLSMPYPISYETENDSWLNRVKQAVQFQEEGIDLQKKFVEQLLLFFKMHPQVPLSHEMEEKLSIELQKHHFFIPD